MGEGRPSKFFWKQAAAVRGDNVNRRRCNESVTQNSILTTTWNLCKPHLQSKVTIS